MGDRHAFRAKWHDYNGGIYFVTICCRNKLHLLGSIINGVMNYTPLGRLVEESIAAFPLHYQDIEVWNHVVMPNHIHMILAIGTRLIVSAEEMPSRNNRFGCLKQPEHRQGVDDFHHNSKLASVIGAFKAGVTRTARTRLIASLPCWQSRYHEHIIRNQCAFDYIMAYIDSNVDSWNKDCFY